MDPDFATPPPADDADLTQKATAVTSAYPPPPPFWRNFTSENLERLERSKNEYIEKNKDDTDAAKLLHDGHPETLKKLELPPQVRYLIPPDIPTESYSLFGEEQKVSRYRLTGAFAPRKSKSKPRC